MKKVLLVVSLISVLLLAGCNKSEEINNNINNDVPEVVRDNQQQVITNNEEENETIINNEQHQLLDNEVFLNGKVYTLNYEKNENSLKVVLNDFEPIIIEINSAFVPQNDTNDVNYYVIKDNNNKEYLVFIVDDADNYNSGSTKFIFIDDSGKVVDIFRKDNGSSISLKSTGETISNDNTIKDSSIEFYANYWNGEPFTDRVAGKYEVYLENGEAQIRLIEELNNNDIDIAGAT